MSGTFPTSDSAPGANVGEFTVGELSERLKRVVEDEFGYVRVRGEISGLKRAASGHVYLSLKDERAVLDAVMWRPVAQRHGKVAADGLEVVCTGRLTTYAQRSRYQLVIEHIEPAGVGALMALLEERRRKLAAEGLFDEDRKRALPFLPEVIGVVTSPSGAVIRDIMHRLRERFPRRVLVWPVLVQGEGAAEQIADAIHGFNDLGGAGDLARPDVLVVARGGGSLEDLWAFNEEVVVRAAAASEIPLISAVGHETDTTLIDFAADRRAPTPTAAAEIAVPVRGDLIRQVLEREQRLYGVLKRTVDYRRTELAGLARGLVDPRRLIESHVQRLDDLGDGLRRALALAVGQRRTALADIAAGLRPSALRSRHERAAGDLKPAAEALARDWARRRERLTDHLASLDRLLESFSYRNVLDRGFAVVRDEADRPVLRAAATRAGAAVAIEFADGRVGARIEGKTPASGRAGEKRKAGGKQQSLF